uniref:F-box domain-containing protein n=1 Tax=Panagrellus redivivus TaxID=6233 RepID=A0A7E4UMN7_PANRE
MTEASIDSLPMLVLEHIFHFVRPYRSLDSARCVNSQWRDVVDDCVRHMKRRFSACTHLTWHSIGEKLYSESFSAYISERGGHAARYSRSDNCMYMFGGCTARYVPLADMWRLNMDSLEWQRIIQQGEIPPARSLCTLLDCGDLLVLFGGYAKSSNNPINQNVQFFGDLYFFLKNEQRWINLTNESTPTLASHGAVILKNRFMVVTGGSTGEDFSDDVYICDLANQSWSIVYCAGWALIFSSK